MRIVNFLTNLHPVHIPLVSYFHRLMPQCGIIDGLGLHRGRIAIATFFIHSSTSFSNLVDNIIITAF